MTKRLLPAMLVSAVLVLAGCGASGSSESSPEQFPVAYPFAGSALADSDVNVSVSVKAPEKIVAGIPAPVVVTVSSTGSTVTAPTLLLSPVTPALGTTVPLTSVRVESAAGDATRSGLGDANPFIGLRWAQAASPLEYQLPPAAVDGTVDIPLLVTVNDASAFIAGALFAASASDSPSSESVMSDVTPAGLPTPKSTTMWAQAMARLPENLRDPIPAPAASPPTQGTSTADWVPSPVAPTVTRSATGFDPAGNFDGLTVDQIIALQAQPVVAKTPVLSSLGCDLAGGSCDVTVVVPASGAAAGLSDLLMSVFASSLEDGTPVADSWNVSATANGATRTVTSTVFPDRVSFVVDLGDTGDSAVLPVKLRITSPPRALVSATLQFGGTGAFGGSDTASRVDGITGLVISEIDLPGQMDRSVFASEEYFSPAQVAEFDEKL